MEKIFKSYKTTFFFLVYVAITNVSVFAKTNRDIFFITDGTVVAGGQNININANKERTIYVSPKTNFNIDKSTCYFFELDTTVSNKIFNISKSVRDYYNINIKENRIKEQKNKTTPKFVCNEIPFNAPFSLNYYKGLNIATLVTSSAQNKVKLTKIIVNIYFNKWKKFKTHKKSIEEKKRFNDIFQDFCFIEHYFSRPPPST